MAGSHEDFDAVATRLQPGIHLIEASAGTGKTYAIAMLALRAVVELGVSLDKILIVTFTKAATEELRARVRRRLAEARDLLAADGRGSDDPTLTSWLAGIGERKTAERRIALALLDIDRAPIFTIHGFCQRMLTDHALESGQLFTSELLADLNPLSRQIACDFWRHWVYPLKPAVAAVIEQKVGEVGELLTQVQRPGGTRLPVEPIPEGLAAASDRYLQTLAKLRFWWQGDGRVMAERYQDAAIQGYINKDKKLEFATWWQQVSLFFSGISEIPPQRLEWLRREGVLARLNGSKLRSAAKKEEFLQDWEFNDSLVLQLEESIDRLVLELRLGLAIYLREQLEIRLQERGQLGFDDVVSRLAEAVVRPDHTLARMVRERYQVALIDEFQDTDSQQWQIFHNIFSGQRQQLYLIGDPKQSIYRFRGADIHSYFRAKRSAQRILGLGKNYRSHPHLVAEINRLFSSHPHPFYYEGDLLNYHMVRAGQNRDKLDLRAGKTSQAAMVYWNLGPRPESRDGRHSGTSAGELLQPLIAQEISTLLDPLEGYTLVEDGRSRPLQAQDIAVLVRSHRQAEELKQVLVASGVPAVNISRESVFSSEECQELLLLLHGLLSPRNHRVLKAALSISWFGLSGNDLYMLWQDDQRLQQVQGRYHDYGLQWRDRGLMVMLERLLREEGVWLRLAAEVGAERRIVNIRQLLELAGAAEQERRYGPARLVQWLQRVQQEAGGVSESELLLESDEDAVRLVTMHSCKGLEYPVVFCPYLWYRRDALADETTLLICHNEDGELVADFGSPRFAERLTRSRAEALAEELRLAYVALTRAKCRCYLLWADVKGHGAMADSFSSALGYLLFKERPESSEVQSERLQKLATVAGVSYLSVALGAKPAGLVRSGDGRGLMPQQRKRHKLQSHWQLTSYSAMAALNDYNQEHHEVQEGGQAIELVGLPAGARFGNLVHDLLEELPFAELAGENDFGQEIEACSKRYGVDVAPPVLRRLLYNVVQSPLRPSASGPTFRLADLPEHDCLKEMDFYFQLGPVETDGLTALLAEEPSVSPLPRRSLQGYLTGFVDLLCRYGGKYYILDYKTNWLGDRLASYHPELLSKVMRGHNYGLQYYIYSVVIHRYLKNIHPGYRYREHFGGIFYLFVRGMGSDSAPGYGIYYSRPQEQKIEQLARVMAGGEHG